MDRRFALGLAAALSAATAGCVFGDLDYTGKACPCPPGWMCGGPDCTCLPDDGSACQMCVSGFGVEWVTSESIRWGWDPPALELAEVHESYRLDLRAEDGTVIEYTADTNPELGQFSVPWTGGEDIVHTTITAGLDASQTYTAQLAVTDIGSCTWTSASVTKSTDPPTLREAWIFDETATTYMAPPEAVVVANAAEAHRGEAFFEWTAPKTEGENIKVGDVAVPLDQVGQSISDSAFVEFATALETSEDVHCYYMHVHLRLGEGRHANLEPLTLRADPDYQIVQIPLAAMTLRHDDGTSPPPLSEGDVIDQFFFGCSPWEAGSIVRLDSVRIRW